MKPIFLQIIDSRGNPTIRGKLGSITIGVPSGASTGEYEALELRDGGQNYEGKEVLKAINNANYMSDSINWENANVYDSDRILLELDGTPNKSNMGANAILAVSMMQVSLQAAQQGKELFQMIAELTGNEPSLPTPFANIINGGKHAGNDLMVQEFMIVPHANSFYEATMIVAEVDHALKELITEKYGPEQTGLGDEGGFAPDIRSAEEAIDLILEAAKRANKYVSIAIDAAASEFYNNGRYEIESGKFMTPGELEHHYLNLLSKYPIISLEDPFDQNDFDSFARLRSRIKERNIQCQIVGDDLTVTNPNRIKIAIENGSCDCLLLKINQIGSITEAFEACRMAKEAGWNVMVSHRSGDTSDTFLAELATGLGTGQIKIGAPARGERTAKYNKLLELEAQYGLNLTNNI